MLGLQAEEPPAPSTQQPAQSPEPHAVQGDVVVAKSTPDYKSEPKNIISDNTLVDTGSDATQNPEPSLEATPQTIPTTAQVTHGPETEAIPTPSTITQREPSNAEPSTDPPRGQSSPVPPRGQGSPVPPKGQSVPAPKGPNSANEKGDDGAPQTPTGQIGGMFNRLRKAWQGDQKVYV